MIKAAYKTTTYRIGRNWMIDIVERFDKAYRGKIFEVWYYRTNYGVKELMFGFPEYQFKGTEKEERFNIDDIIDMATCDFDSYKRIYDEQYAE